MAPNEAAGTPEVTITIGADGRVYFHDLPPDLLEVAAALAPEWAGIARRCAAREASGSEGDHDQRCATDRKEGETDAQRG